LVAAVFLSAASGFCRNCISLMRVLTSDYRQL
jgi:hypothetical protein